MITTFITPKSKWLMLALGITQDEVEATLNAMSTAGLENSDGITATHWISDQKIIFVDGLVIKKRKSHTGTHDYEILVNPVLRLASSLPGGEITPEMSTAEILTIVAASFGQPLRGHPDQPYAFLYNGPWDRQDVMRTASRPIENYTLTGTFHFDPPTCKNLWLFDFDVYRTWFLKHSNPDELEVFNDPIKKLSAFMVAYGRALNELLMSFPSPKFPQHSLPITSSYIIQASDGVLTFYYPDNSGGPPPGIHLLDYSGYTMDQIASSMHKDTIRIIPRSSPVRPTKIDPLSEVTVSGVSEAYLAYSQRLLENGSRELPGLGVVIKSDWSDDSFVGFKPGRTSVWSPLFTQEGRKPARMYKWLRAEVWTGLETLKIDGWDAVNAAKNDRTSLITILRAIPFFDTEQAAIPPELHAVEILKNKWIELLALLEEHGGNEEKIHQWLFKPANQVFLDAEATDIQSKVRFGNKVSDFVVRQSNGAYTLVEIERANLRIFTKGTQEKTAELNHACQQVKDWQRYIRENMHTVRHTLKLPEIYEPKGIVVLGRSADIQGEEARERWRDLKTNSDPQIMTYDDLIDRVKALADSLKRTFQN